MRKGIIIHILLFLLILTGCTQESSEKTNQETKQTDTATKTTTISITDFADRKVTFDKVPNNIVALSNGDMDIVNALGGHLVGRPTAHETNPNPKIEAVEQVGSSHEFDLEKIASAQADVVLGSNPMNIKDVASVEGIGAKMILTNANSIKDIQKQILLFGDLLQKREKAAELNKNIDDKLDAISKNQPNKKVRVLLIYGAPGTYMAALPNSLSGNILETVGGENIAADYPALEQYPQYAQLNTERVIEANPQYVLLMSHGNPKEVKEGFLNEMKQNAAWNGLDAVKNNHVEVLPSNLFGTNPGTQISEAIDLLDGLLKSVKQ
ncbi:ABC transporter substrate-binding protein [Bacillus massiliigorillae]|uniref:ABC transporter substrate-binding protein n=1 Tax=Bacillus massiliigorillae TaxID=1243664 RepID=UPI0003A782DE|nr:ABC transporter substrate-binding protein [Bacillus massiliigorillae]